MTGLNNGMTTIVAHLRKEQERLEGVVSELAAGLKEAETALKTVKDSLRPLTGGRPSQRGRKPSPSKAEVARIIASALDGRELSEEELRKHVEAEVTALGRGKYGLSTRIDEVLNSNAIQKTADGYRIAAAEGGER